MDHRNVSGNAPDGWVFVDGSQSKSKSSYFYCPATNQRFNTRKDLMRYINYAKRKKLSIYAPDFCTFTSEMKSDPKDMYSSNHNQVLTEPSILSQDSYTSTSDVEVDAGVTHETTCGQNVMELAIVPIPEDYHPVFQLDAINEVANQEVWDFIRNDLVNYNLSDLGVDLECDLSLNPHQIGFGQALSGSNGNCQKQQQRSSKIICYQRRKKRTSQ